MPVESASTLRELNSAWPLDTDLVTAGAAHLRLMKSLLGSGFLGAFVDQAALDTYVAAPVIAFVEGQTFYLEGNLWVVVLKSTLSNSLDLEGVWQSLDGTYGALATSQISRLGGLEAFNSLGKFVVSSQEARRSQAKYSLLTTGTEFSVADANNQFPNGTPVQGDVIFQYLDLPPNVQTFIKVWTGTEWGPVDLKLFNHIAAFGQFCAHSIVTARIDSDVDRAIKRETIGETHIHVFNPDGWGDEGLIEWFGEKAFFVDTDGEVTYENLSIANGIYYRTQDGFYGRDGAEQTPGTTPSGLTLVAGVGGLAALYETDAISPIPPEPFIQRIALTLYNTGAIDVTTGGNSQLIAGVPETSAYLDATGANSGDAYEVLFESNTIKGARTDYAGLLLDVWYPLTVNRSFAVTLSKFANESPVLDETIDLTITVREIAFPATLVTANVSLKLNIN